MKIKLKPRNLQTLEVICEILYKLHPSVLDNLLEMEEMLGPVLGFHSNTDDLTSEQRDILEKFGFRLVTGGEQEQEQEQEDEANNIKFDELLKYLKLDTDEYIPIEFYVKVEDRLVGEKVQELIKIIERTKAKEEFSNMRREEDWHAYFGESYNNEELRKKTTK